MPTGGNLTVDVLSRKVIGLRKKNLSSEPSGNKSSNRAVKERGASCLQLNKRKEKQPCGCSNTSSFHLESDPI